MPAVVVVDKLALVLQAGKAARLLTTQLAEHLRISRRTMSRWIAGGYTNMTPGNWVTLARLVYPNDRALAATLAGVAGGTLEGLGIASPPPPAPSPPPTPSVTQADLADLVVHAAAEAANLPPQAVRPIIASALDKAAALGLSVEAMREAMTAGKAEKAEKGKGRTGRAAP
jgi:hypothetical protein